ncbi:MAG TPA: DUF3426 domain-containing protein [Accumulibacter sp.]|uniref:DUF3426 domain-containing protein n=1 Tax=Accumulibacter sp. TaxID=2053492 RepID=UPI002C8BFB20|nr:DUF3426 domain-containing protein [Accumulibacter sp.]HRD87333.1 DUF3426 domain-containing protein [Accumulibacter sp.]
MRTCCPTCRTVFRVTSEQLRLRAGKVRCGQCRAVFNAIENLFDGDSLASSPPAPVAAAAGATPPLPPATRASARTEPAPGPTDPAATAPAEAGTSAVEDVIDIATLPASVQGADEPAEELPPADRRFPDAAADDHSPPGTADDLSAPSQWAAEVPGAPSPAERSVRLTFIVVAILLACVLAGQIVFHQRGSIAISAPTLRPLLEGLSTAFGSAVPLPRQAELVSIESSDLQADPGRDKLLVLQATLRNRAAYAQAYPALELTLTDTRDKAIARRVLLPEDYLSPAALENGPFPTNAEMEVKIWLEARQIDAAGYRLYVFYP